MRYVHYSNLPVAINNNYFEKMRNREVYSVVGSVRFHPPFVIECNRENLDTEIYDTMSNRDFVEDILENNLDPVFINDLIIGRMIAMFFIPGEILKTLNISSKDPNSFHEQVMKYEDRIRNVMGINFIDHYFPDMDLIIFGGMLLTDIRKNINDNLHMVNTFMNSYKFVDRKKDMLLEQSLFFRLPENIITH